MEGAGAGEEIMGVDSGKTSLDYGPLTSVPPGLSLTNQCINQSINRIESMYIDHDDRFNTVSIISRNPQILQMR